MVVRNLRLDPSPPFRRGVFVKVTLLTLKSEVVKVDLDFTCFVGVRGFLPSPPSSEAAMKPKRAKAVRNFPLLL